MIHHPRASMIGATTIAKPRIREDYRACAEAGMTAQEAADHLGVSRQAVQAHGKRHGFKFRRVAGSVMIRGKLYDSAFDAARDQGVNLWTVYRHLSKGTADMIGLGQRVYRRICKVDGVVYPSIRAAARAAGVSAGSMYWRIKSEQRREAE